MKPGEREALKEWDSHLRAIRRATPVDADEPPRAKEERMKRLQASFKDFAAYYFPHYCTAPFARFHLRQQRQVFENERAMHVYIMARAHAKSVVHTVLNTIFLMVHGKCRTVILSSYNETNAIRLLRDVQAELENNQRLIADYGVFRGPSNWEAGRFLTQQGCYFVAIGSGQSPRGLRNEPVRPDLILVDDFDEDEQSRNPDRVDNAEQWLRGALFGAFDITGSGRFIMVGNRFATNMVLTRMYEVADFKETVNILDAHGEPSWSERYTRAECDYMVAKMGYNRSQRELFNNPIQEGKTFKREWVQWGRTKDLRQYRALVAYLDPGFKKTATSDSKAWVLVGFTGQQYHVLKAYVGVASIVEMIGWGYEIDAYVQARGGAAQLYMEEVFLQSLLYDDFATEGEKRGKLLPVRGDRRKKPDKDARIEAISGHFERGNVLFNEKEKDSHHMKRLVEQLLNFQPGVKTHKDGPDALEGAMHILQQGMVVIGSDISIGARHKSKYRT